jgi:hypothetical protein
MDLTQFTDFVVHLLIKPDRHLVGVHFFDIPDFPAGSACDIEPIPSFSTRQVLPLLKLPFILFSGAHGEQSS